MAVNLGFLYPKLLLFHSSSSSVIHPLPIRLHGVVLNYLSTGTTLPLLPFLTRRRLQEILPKHWYSSLTRWETENSTPPLLFVCELQIIDWMIVHPSLQGPSEPIIPSHSQSPYLPTTSRCRNLFGLVEHDMRNDQDGFKYWLARFSSVRLYGPIICLPLYLWLDKRET
jgi:hypothetical protein